jgi:hypothetical protein
LDSFGLNPIDALIEKILREKAKGLPAATLTKIVVKDMAQICIGRLGACDGDRPDFFKAYGWCDSIWADVVRKAPEVAMLLAIHTKGILEGCADECKETLAKEKLCDRIRVRTGSFLQLFPEPRPCG